MLLIEICKGALAGSAVIPTIIATFAFLPRHLLKIPSVDEEICSLTMI